MVTAIDTDVSVKNRKLATIAVERGLSFGGFRKDLKALVREYHSWDQYEEWCDDVEESPTQEGYREYLKNQFFELFGGSNIIPAAHRIRVGDKPEKGMWNITVEIYEIENTKEICDDKLIYYAHMADMEGPHFELHIIDKYDNEFIIQSEELMALTISGIKKEWLAERKKEIRSLAVVQHHAPVFVDSAAKETLEREVREMQTELNRPIQERIKEKQARWKVAYDAVRELGIEI
jgi:hypothetical protein